MKSLYPDLFPETLLVDLVESKVMTSSIKISEHFGRRHKDILKAIRNVLARTEREEHRRNFAPMLGRDNRGRRQDYFLLTQKGFQFVATGLTGSEADGWKWKFLDAFEAMEKHIHAQTAAESKALYQLRPRWQPIVQHPELNRQKLIGLTGHKSAGSITACRRRMRDIGLLGLGC